MCSNKGANEIAQWKIQVTVEIIKNIHFMVTTIPSKTDVTPLMPKTVPEMTSQ